MTQIKAVIIDDESHCIGSLKIQLAEHAPSVQVVGNAQSVPEGIDLILNTHPDLVFLDIAMPGKNGFDLLHEIPQRDFEVIFTTAYNQYALEAFKVNAADYLMKPVEPDELKRAVDKVKISIERTTDGPSQDKKNWEKLLENLKASVFDQTISLPTFEGIERIPVHRILFVEADGNYSTFWLTQEEKLVVSKTLKEIESILEEFGFLRVHHSNVVNIRKVKRYIRGDGGFLVMENGREVSVSRSRKNSLLHALNVKT